MQNFIPRHIESTIVKYLEIFPCVAILGARQCGKSTLLKQMASRFSSFLYLDLQSSSLPNFYTRMASHLQ